MFEWNDEVLDIREHYPLLDLPEVVKNNEDLKQDYFNKQDPPYVLTTTFLLTLKDKQQIAIEVKLSADLQKKISFRTARNPKEILGGQRS